MLLKLDKYVVAQGMQVIYDRIFHKCVFFALSVTFGLTPGSVIYSQTVIISDRIVRIRHGLVTVQNKHGTVQTQHRTSVGGCRLNPSRIELGPI